MNIIDLVNKNKDPRSQQSAQPQQPKSPRSEYLDLKKDLPKEVQADIANFRAKFPQLREHVIFRIMRKHDMKMNLVEPELKFNAEMQGSQPVEEREPRSKRPFVPRDQRPPENRKPHEERKKTGEGQAQADPKKEGEGEGREGRGHGKKEGDKGSFRGPEIREKKQRPSGEWQGRARDPNFKPQEFVQQREHKETQSAKQGNFGNRQPEQNFQAKRPYNKKNGSKRHKGQWNDRDDSDEYVARQPEEDKPKSVKPPSEDYQQRALSNINEESEDQSHHRLQVGDSNEKHRQGKSQPPHESQKSGPGGDKGVGGGAGHFRQEDTQGNPSQQVANGHSKYHQGESAGGSHRHAKLTSPENSSRALDAEAGLSVVARFFEKKTRVNLKQLVDNTRSLENRLGKGDGRGGQEKRPPFVETKKRKPATKKNFETEENDESNNERAKKMNYHVGTKRFESEEERMKGDRERNIEIIQDKTLGMINLLTQKVKALEEEIAGLRGAQEQAEAKNGEENVYCLVPFHLVRDQYPFSSIKVSEVKSGTVYFVKKD